MTLSTLSKTLVSLSFLACTSLFAAPLVVDVTGIQSWGLQGNAGNTVLTYNVGAGATVTSIGFNVNLTAISPSWLSEISMKFTDSIGNGVIFNPGGSDVQGTASYSGYYALSDFNLVFQVGADGILRLEFYESFDDFAGVDGSWNFGTLTFGITPAAVVDVPEPGSGILLGAGLGVMACAVRRRTLRAASVPA